MRGTIDAAGINEAVANLFDRTELFGRIDNSQRLRRARRRQLPGGGHGSIIAGSSPACRRRPLCFRRSPAKAKAPAASASATPGGEWKSRRTISRRQGDCPLAEPVADRRCGCPEGRTTGASGRRPRRGQPAPASGPSPAPKEPPASQQLPAPRQPAARGAICGGAAKILPDDLRPGWLGTHGRRRCGAGEMTGSRPSCGNLPGVGCPPPCAGGAACGLHGGARGAAGRAGQRTSSRRRELRRPDPLPGVFRVVRRWRRNRWVAVLQVRVVHAVQERRPWRNGSLRCSSPRRLHCSGSKRAAVW